MKPLVLGQLPMNATAEQKLNWIIQSLRTIELASQQQDVARIADSYTTTGTATATRDLNVTAPTLANAVAVLATFLADTRARGVRRVAPT
jgi:hypothetical protein